MACTLTSTDDTKNIDYAFTLVESVAALDVEDPTYQVLNSNGEVLLKAILCLFKQDVKKTLSVLESMLVDVDKKVIAVSTEVKFQRVTIRNVDMFRRITVSAVKHLLPLLRGVRGESLLSLFFTLYGCIDVKSSSSVLVTQIMFLLLKKGLLNASLERYENKILSLAGTFASFSLHRKAGDNLNSIAQVIIADWTVDKQKRTLDLILNSVVWDNFIAFVLVHLMSVLDSGIILSFFDVIGRSVRCCLTKGDLYHEGLNILKELVTVVDAKTCLNDLYPILVEEVTEHGEERELFAKTIIKDCAKVFINHYGVHLYMEVKNSYNSWSYLALKVFCTFFCAQANFIGVENLRAELTCLYPLCKTNVLQHYVIKTVCHYKDKDQIVESWRMDLVNTYLQDLMFLPDSLYCLDDLSRLTSQISITANRLNFDDLDPYVQFIHDTYDYCMINLKSKCLERVKIAGEVYNMVEQTFANDSTFLNTKYNLPLSYSYNKREGSFYLFLVANGKWPFMREETFKSLYNEFHNTTKVYSQITTSMMKWLNNYTISDDFDFKTHFSIGLNILKTRYDFETVNKGYHYILISLSNNIQNDSNANLIVDEWERTFKKLLSSEEPFDCLEKTPLYGLTACIYILTKQKHLVTAHKKNFDSCIEIVEYLLFLSVHADYNSASLHIHKAIELTIVTCFDIMALVFQSEDVCSEQRLNLTRNGLRIAQSVVELGNMKRPVESSASLISKICSNNNEEVLKFHLNVLSSLKGESMNTFSKVRRNPEHRLVLHSIIVASKKFQYSRLNLTMKYLTQILLNPNSFVNSITSSLHTIEILVSDNTMGQLMFPYVEAVTKCCLMELSNEDWRVRNAAIQVYNALVRKILGQKSNSLHRRHTIDDVFVMFPQLIRTFYDKLNTANINKELDTVVGILTFFSEAHRKPLFTTREVDVISKKILRLLIHYINTDQPPIGLYAAKAYAALYPHQLIPSLIRKIVNWLTKNFLTTKKNVFYAYYCLLRELKSKFETFPNVSYYDGGRRTILSALNKFSLDLEKYNDQYEIMFTSLGIRTNSLGNIIKCIPTNVQLDTLHSRRWLTLNVFYALEKVDVREFCVVLDSCLRCECISIQDDCLKVIEGRLKELKEKSLIGNVLNVVLTKFFGLAHCFFLIRRFSYVIFLLLDGCVSIDFKFEPTTVGKSIYVVSVYVGLLSLSNRYEGDQNVFIKSTLEGYSRILTDEDHELQLFVASTLKYLYKCVDVSDRCTVLKFAFVLLINSDASEEIFKFLSTVFNTSTCDVRSSCNILLSFDNLAQQFNSRRDVCRFFNGLATFILGLDEGYVFDNQFYLKQNLNICVNKYFIKRLLLDKTNEILLQINDEECVNAMLKVKHLLT